MDTPQERHRLDARLCSSEVGSMPTCRRGGQLVGWSVVTPLAEDRRLYGYDTRELQDGCSDVQKFLLQEEAMNLLWMLWVHKDRLRWTQQWMWWVR